MQHQVHLDDYSKNAVEPTTDQHLQNTVVGKLSISSVMLASECFVFVPKLSAKLISFCVSPITSLTSQVATHNGGLWRLDNFVTFEQMSESEKVEGNKPHFAGFLVIRLALPFLEPL